MKYRKKKKRKKEKKEKKKKRKKEKKEKKKKNDERMNCDGLDTFRWLIAILNALDGRWRIAWKIEHGVENNIIRIVLLSL